jgi:hypothetical protein
MHRHVARRRAAAPPTGGIIVTMPPTASMTLRMLRGQRATRCLLDAGLLLAAMLLAGAASVLLLRQDVNWDLQNYHFYNGWAFVHGRLGWDLAPAHGLRRMPGGCASIVSNISPDPLELCLLDRIHSPG